MSPTIVALIPARAGSKRVPGKNTRLLGGVPLIQWTIEAAKSSGIFREIIVSSDSPDTLAMASAAGTRVSVRLPEHATDESPDMAWVAHVLLMYKYEDRPDAFAILRPTSPFRTAGTIQAAWRVFLNRQPCDSVRAIEPVKQHPLKMWQMGFEHGEIRPLLAEWAWPRGVPERAVGLPFHSRPTQTLPAVFAQNASLEIAWVKTVINRGSISGDRVMPFITEGYEGINIDTEDDWQRAASLVRDGLVGSPAVAAQAASPPPV